MIGRAHVASDGLLMVPPAPTGLRISTERLRCLMLWLTGASGAVVFIEPSPYEAMSFLTIAMFMIGGLTLSPRLMPLPILLVLLNIGYSISGWTVIQQKGVAMWLITSWYLAFTAVFFAVMLGVNTQARLDALMRGCLIGGVIAALGAIIGYSRLIPSLNDTLLLYDRARSTFKDPNVLGAFLILPTLLALQPVVAGNARQALRGALLLVLLIPAVLLSFSRAAWGQTVYCSLLVLALTFATTRSPSQRLRIVLLSVAGAVVMAAFIGALLSIDAVGELFKERASLHQSYDVGAQGRFARYYLGGVMMLDRPFGIGPLQFSKYFPEDTHDSFLNAFTSGGWLGGICYPTLVALTLIYGFRVTLMRTPWQQTAITIFAAYVGVVTESIIIDVDHWRHTFLLTGLLWGLIAASPGAAARAETERTADPSALRPAPLAPPWRAA